jgi:DNA end-binding protein Ku
LELSAILVASFAADFAPENFTDEYQAQLRELIDAKLQRGDSVNTDETFGRTPGDSGDGGESEEGATGGGGVLDLMEALRRSVDKNRSEKDRSEKNRDDKTPASGQGSG